jgi:hypothetical protein
VTCRRPGELAVTSEGEQPVPRTLDVDETDHRARGLTECLSRRTSQWVWRGRTYHFVPIVTQPVFACRLTGEPGPDEIGTLAPAGPRPAAASARRYVAMQMAMTIKRRSIGLGASVPYASQPFWLSVPAVGGVGRLPATTP